MTKPLVKLSGENGNVFNLIAICRTALKRAGQSQRADEMTKKIMSEAKDYDHALRIMMEYCVVV